MERAEPAAIYTELRQLAAANPRAARVRVCELLDGDFPWIEDVLRLAAAPGEGRLRQLLAQAAQVRNDKTRLVPHLLRWAERESDEFARAAIHSALADVDAAAFRKPEGTESRQMVEAYRYAADRLCHRLRNSLTGLPTHLRKLEALLGGDAAGDGRALLNQLKDALREVSRVAEFDMEDAYFEWQTLDLGGWLRTMNAAYAAKYAPVVLSLTGPLSAGEVRIRANSLNLDTLFWNLWKNAQQAVEGSCEITIRSANAGGRAELLILDNGKGFSVEDAELVFMTYFKRRGFNFGRGLLEVHDAVVRLKGTAQVVSTQTDGRRIKLTFPIALA